MKNENWVRLNLRQKIGFWLVRKLASVQVWVQENVLRTMIWKCSDGRCIPVEKMDNDHLNSAIRMLIREGSRERELTYLVKEQVRRNALFFVEETEET